MSDETVAAGGEAPARAVAAGCATGTASVEEGLQLVRAFRSIGCAATRARLLKAVLAASGQPAGAPN